jgi:hypothetical protein
MANILNELDQDCWVPGIVKSVEYDDLNVTNVYTIIYYNGEEGENVNAQLVRISKATYDLVVEFIMSKLLKPDQPKSRKGMQKPTGFDWAYFIMHSEEYRSLRGTYQPLLEPVDGSGSLIANDEDGNAMRPHSYDLIEGLLERRRTLPALQVGQEVLAKWPDDHLYHQCVVIEALRHEQTGKYRCEDAKSKNSAVVNREDILTSDQSIDMLTPSKGVQVRLSFCCIYSAAKFTFFHTFSSASSREKV